MVSLILLNPFRSTGGEKNYHLYKQQNKTQQKSIKEALYEKKTSDLTVKELLEIIK
jgi:hypothetical protein